MQNKIVKSKILSSLIWKFLERGGTQGIQFILQIFLARLLTPNDYGIIALITIFIALARVFVQSGFNTALIQGKDINEEDYSSVFYLSMFVATILYIILFLTAPIVADFYKVKDLILILRVLSLTLFIGAVTSIQNAIVARKMQFKKLFLSSLGAMAISGTIGIIMAYKGYGVWALVYQQLSNQLLITMILWMTVKWRPKLCFSFKRIKTLFSYGGKLLASSLLDTLYKNLRSLIIGKVYSPSILGYYNRGNQFPQIIVTNINGSITSVLLSAMSAEQEDRFRVKQLMRRAIVTSSFILFPIMMGLAIISKPLVMLLLTEKWLPCVPFIWVFCGSYSLWPIHTVNLQAINALGRSDIFLKLEIIKKILGVVILVISVKFGVYVIALGMLLSGIISTFINSYPNKKLLNYSYKEQMVDILPSLLISLIMGAIVYQISYFVRGDLFLIVAQVISGGIFYIILATIFKLECYKYLLSTIKEIFINKRRSK